MSLIRPSPKTPPGAGLDLVGPRGERYRTSREHVAETDRLARYRREGTVIDQSTTTIVTSPEVAAFLLPIAVSNQWYGCFSLIPHDNQNNTLTANTLYGTLVGFARQTSVDALGIHVGTAAGTLARLGIYSFAETAPNALLLDAGTVSTASTGLKTIAISSFTFDAGVLYVLALVADGTPILRAIEANVAFLGASSLTSTTYDSMWTRTFTFGALPSTFAATGRTNGAIRIGAQAV